MNFRAAILFGWCAWAGTGAGCTPNQAEPVPKPTASPGAARPPGAPPRRPLTVSIRMQKVRLHLTDSIALDVENLEGAMIGRRPGNPPVFDDAQSYVLRVDTAGMSLDMPSLTNLLNQHVFAHEGARLRDVSVAVARDGRLSLKGTLHKGIPVRFSSGATVAANPDGKLRLHVESVSAIGVPVKGLMDLLGLELDDMMDVERRRDISIQDDDILISPGAALPPPQMSGRLTKAVAVGQRIELTFGTSPRRTSAIEPPVKGARNYIYFGGGAIRFGKLTMQDADLQLIDADPRDPFDFFPARYQRQLVAGYSKNTPLGGLRTFLPDYDDLVRRGEIDLRPRRARSSSRRKGRLRVAYAGRV